jgi:hypothetical protein
MRKNIIFKVVNAVKDLSLKKGSLISAVLLAIIAVDCNSTCCFVMHQPELPKECNEFRKFIK